MFRSMMREYSMVLLILIDFVQQGYTASIDETRQKVQAKKKDKFTKLVEKYGYPVEQHDVITEDGYILTTHRMPGRPGESPILGKPAVILLHGQFASSISWVMRGPGKSLSISLVDAGYDVWHLNARGNSYCRRHVKFPVKGDDFWKFSWHEVGVYDLAANVDYVLNLCGLKKVSLVGHSMGVLVSHAFLSHRPEYNEKINIVVSLAPSVIFTHMPYGSTYGLITDFGVQFEEGGKRLMRQLGMYGIFEDGIPPLIIRLAKSLCGMQDFGLMCWDMMFFILPFPDYDQLDLQTQVEMMEYYPDSTSIQCLSHYRQVVTAGKFLKYDWGPKKNLVLYGQVEVPAYALWNITAPSVLYYGPNDGIATKADAEALAKFLPNVVVKAVPHHMFNHLDFVLAKDVQKILYNDVIETINNSIRQPSI